MAGKRGAFQNPLLWLFISGVIGSVWLYYPGYMSYDALNQLLQARTLTFDDWQPPFLAFVWGGVDRLVPGPALMLVWQNLMLWGGLALVVGYGRRRRAALAMVLIGLFPPIFASVGTIWKDSALAASLLLAIGLLAYSDRTHKRWAAWVAVVPLFYAMALRHNAIPAVLPPLIWWAYQVVVPQWRGRVALKPLVAIGSAVVVSLGFFGLVTGINTLIIKYPTYPVQQILTHDIVAISIADNQVYLPPELNDPPFTIPELRALYTPDTVVPLFCCSPDRRQIERVRYKSQGFKVDALERAWLTTVPSHLPAYFSHRAAALAALLGVGRAKVCWPFEYEIQPNNMGLTFTRNPVNHWLTYSLFFPLQDTLLFRVWVYGVLAIVLLVCLRFAPPPNRVPIAVLAGSGLAYMVPYAFVATACDLRLSYWLIVATMAAAALYFIGCYTDSQRRSSIYE